MLRRVHLIAVAGVSGDDCEIAFVMEVIAVVVVVCTDTGGDDLHRAVMVDVLRAACRGAQVPTRIVFVFRLVAGVHMAELIVPDGLPVIVAILGQHHDNRAALADTVLTIQIAQRNGDDQLVLVVRLTVQIRRFQMYHGGVFCDMLLTVFVQKLNVIQRFAEIILQRFVSADVQYIFTAVIAV